MMTEYHLQPNARRCSSSGKPLLPGDRYFSVLLEENGRLRRLDFAANDWQGPPPNAFSFWSGRIPLEGKKRKLTLDEDTLRECFERLEGTSDPGKIRLRYVLALLLLRQRRLQLEDTQHEDGQEFLQLRDGRSGRRFRVLNPQLSEDEMLEVQEEVLQALGWDG
jgi:hypothetical protein